MTPKMKTWLTEWKNRIIQRGCVALVAVLLGMALLAMALILMVVVPIVVVLDACFVKRTQQDMVVVPA